ncbi:MAG: hypothetical protein ACQEP8_05935 [Chlamydiota bacterium]
MIPEPSIYSVPPSSGDTPLFFHSPPSATQACWRGRLWKHFSSLKGFPAAVKKACSSTYTTVEELRDRVGPIGRLGVKVVEEVALEKFNVTPLKPFVTPRDIEHTLLLGLDRCNNKTQKFPREKGKKGFILDICHKLVAIGRISDHKESGEASRALQKQLLTECFPHGVSDLPLKPGVNTLLYRLLGSSRAAEGLEILARQYLAPATDVEKIEVLEEQLGPLATNSCRVFTTFVESFLIDDEYQKVIVQAILSEICMKYPPVLEYIREEFKGLAAVTELAGLEYHQLISSHIEQLQEAMLAVGESVLAEGEQRYFSPEVKSFLKKSVYNYIFHGCLIAWKNVQQYIMDHPQFLKECIDKTIDLDCHSREDQRTVFQQLSDDFIAISFPPSEGDREDSGYKNLPLPPGIKRVFFTALKDKWLPMWLQRGYAKVMDIDQTAYPTREELRKAVGEIFTETSLGVARLSSQFLVQESKNCDEDSLMRTVAEYFCEQYHPESLDSGSLQKLFNSWASKGSSLLPSRSQEAIEGKITRHIDHGLLIATRNFSQKINALQHQDPHYSWHLINTFSKTFYIHLTRFDYANKQCMSSYKKGPQELYKQWLEAYGKDGWHPALNDENSRRAHLKEWSHRLVDGVLFPGGAKDLPVAEQYRDKLFIMIRDQLIPSLLDKLMGVLADKKLTYALINNFFDPSQKPASGASSSLGNPTDTFSYSGEIFTYFLKNVSPALYKLLQQATAGFSKAGLSDSLEDILRNKADKMLGAAAADKTPQELIEALLQRSNPCLLGSDFTQSQQSPEELKTLVRERVANYFASIEPITTSEVFKHIGRHLENAYDKLNDLLQDIPYLGQPLLIAKHILEFAVFGAIFTVQWLIKTAGTYLSEAPGIQQLLGLYKNYRKKYHLGAADKFIDLLERPEHENLIWHWGDDLINALSQGACHAHEMSLKQQNT